MIEIDGYPIDVAVMEEHSHEAEVTQWPVEEGADFSDHVRLLPDVVTIEGVVSDSPIGEVAAVRTSGVLPSEEAYATLIAIRETRQPVSIKTSITTYHNMILKSLSEPKSVAIGESLRFRATFVKIEIVTTERTAVKVTLPRAKKKTKIGAKPSQLVDQAAIDSKTKADSDVDKMKKRFLQYVNGERSALGDLTGL